MRILMVSARYHPFVGGTETHIHEVSRRLAERGHDVGILTADPIGSLPISEEPLAGMRIIRVKSWPAKLDWQFAPGMLRVIAKQPWDIVHVQGYHTFVAPIAMFSAARNEIPFVLSFHSGGHSSRLRNAMRSLQCAALSPFAGRAARCIAVSEFEADYFSKRMRLPRSRFDVIPNGAKLSESAEIVEETGRDCLILSIGRLERYKGHHRAIEAMPHVLKSFPRAQLKILGTGPYERDLWHRIDQLGLNGCVKISSIPSADRRAMASLISRARMVVLFSDYEAHPIAVLEALSLNKQVVVTSTSGLREIAERGLARSVPLRARPTEIAAAMINELESSRPPEAILIPTWEDCTTRLESVYRSALKGPRELSVLAGNNLRAAE
jgi:glycosyltransferase involved in cell wall biosynthesis